MPPPTRITVLLALVLAGGCAPRSRALMPAAIARVFQRHQVTGCFVLHDVARGTAVRHNIDRFWLEAGPLAISADEQVSFLRRFQAGTLPFSKRTQALVREALMVERSAHHVLRAKTGWATRKARRRPPLGTAPNRRAAPRGRPTSSAA